MNANSACKQKSGAAIHKGIRYAAVSALLALACLLSACGYQLQKPLDINSQLQPIYVDATGGLRLAVQRELQFNKLATTQSRMAAGSVLSISNATIESRGQSVSFDGRDAELLRNVNVELHWKDADGKALAQSSLSAEQSHLASPDRRAAQEREAVVLDQLMYADIARQAAGILRHAAGEHANLRR